MQLLQVPTRRIEVDLLLAGGRRLVGYLFLTEAPGQSGGPEDVIQVLNDDREFIPFVSEGATSSATALNKDHILMVQVDSGPDARTGALGAAESEACDRAVLLSDGSRVSGDICIDTPPHASRLVDKLNVADRFVVLQTAGGYAFVQRRQIIHVE
jgi:hypothetical protein